MNLIAQGKVSNYIFGLISAVIIGYFGLVTRVYAEVLLQSFYIIMDITGLYAWLRASEDGSGQVTEVKVLKVFSGCMPFHVAAHWRSCIYFVRFCK